MKQIKTIRTKVAQTALKTIFIITVSLYFISCSSATALPSSPCACNKYEFQHINNDEFQQKNAKETEPQTNSAKTIINGKKTNNGKNS